MDSFYQLLSEICVEEQIELHLLSFGWIYQFKKQNEIRHIIGKNFDLNTEASAKIVGDKYACYEVLKSNHVPVVEHCMIFNPLKRSQSIGDQGNWLKAIDFFNTNQNLVVVKPNTGSQGRNVFLCDTMKALETAVQTIFLDEPSVSLCPFLKIQNEYRVFYVGNECLFAYGKEKAYIIGDGKHTVGQLIKGLSISDENKHCTKPDEYIPTEDEKLYVSWKHNLSNGAQAFQVQNRELKEQLYTLGKQAAKAVHINFATIDIVKLETGELQILEINSGVTSRKLLEQFPELYPIIKKIYAQAIHNMFA